MTDIISNIDGLAEIRPSSPELATELSFTTIAITHHDEELWTKMGQLRAREYLKRGYIAEADIAENGAEYDMYDTYSEHFVAVDNEGDVIGTVRIINREGTGLVLPSEDEFEVTLPTITQEISRLVRSSDLPINEGFVVSLSMMRAALKATVGKSEKIYAVLEDKLHRELSRHIGITLNVVGDPRRIPHYNNTVNHLAEMEPRYITSQIHARDQERIAKARGTRNENTILGKPYAPFFERYSKERGLGRVSLRDLSEPNPDQFRRNEGFFSPEMQEKLFNSTVSIAGVGGDGGELAITLARNGVRKFKLADPENFEIENLNRQAGADLSSIGHNKAEIIAQQLRALNATVEVFPMGVTLGNVEAFVLGTDLVIDETEFSQPHIGIMIGEVARKYELPVLMTLNVGYGAYTTSFSPHGMSLRDYLGIDPGLSIEEIETQYRDKDIPMAKWTPHIPSYGNTNILGRVARKEVSAPTLSQGVHFAAGDAGTQALLHLFREIDPQYAKEIRWAPHGKSVDAFDGSQTIRHRLAHFLLSAGLADRRTQRGLNHPKQ